MADLTETGRWDVRIDRRDAEIVVAARARAADGSVLRRTTRRRVEAETRWDARALDAVRGLLGLALGAPIPVALIRRATIGSGAVLGALSDGGAPRTALATTRGFGDLWRAGFLRDGRGAWFASPPLGRVIEATERVSADGSIATPLDEVDLRDELEAARSMGFSALAIAFVQSRRRSDHEDRAAEIARSCGFEHIGAGAAASSAPSLLDRGRAAVFDASLTPALDGLAARLRAAFDGDLRDALRFETPTGARVEAAGLTGAAAIFGPREAAATGSEAAFRISVGEDATVIRRDGDPDVAAIRVPIGRASRASVVGGRLRIGSARGDGAAEGERGASLEDAACVVGALEAGEDRSDAERSAARARVEAVAAAAWSDRPDGASAPTTSVEAIAEGCLRLAAEALAAAADDAAFDAGEKAAGGDAAPIVEGAGAGLVACAAAEALGVARCRVRAPHGWDDPEPIRAIRRRPLGAPLEANGRLRAAAVLDGAVAIEAMDALAQRGAPRSAIRTTHRLEVIGDGAAEALAIPYGTLREMRAAYAAAHRARFGAAAEDPPLRIEAVTVEAWAAPIADDPAAAALFSNGAWREADFRRRAAMRPGDRLEGPALIAFEDAALRIAAGWRAAIADAGDVILEQTLRETDRGDAEAQATQPNPATAAVFERRAASIVARMRRALAAPREDAAEAQGAPCCAIFDPSGALLAATLDAPLGVAALEVGLRHALGRGLLVEPGDGFIVDGPTDAADGTAAFALAPAWSAANGREPPCLLGYAAARGGDDRSGAPASISADATAPEGRAAIAACRLGAAALARFADAIGPRAALASMRVVLDASEAAIRRILAASTGGAVAYPMDPGADGAPREIRVDAAVDQAARAARIAVAAPVGGSRLERRAAALLAAHRLLGDAGATNAGALRPLDLVATGLDPTGLDATNADASAPAASNDQAGGAPHSDGAERVAAIRSAVLLALGVAAADGPSTRLTARRTDQSAYSVAVPGGAGASPERSDPPDDDPDPGALGSLDPERLERRLPVVVEAVGMRARSGGDGAVPGGHGRILRLRFLEAMRIAVASGHHVAPPPGLDGGAPGGVGRTRIYRADGRVHILRATDAAEVGAGDAIEIETAGGGGCGRKRR